MKSTSAASFVPDVPHGYRRLNAGELREIGDLKWIDWSVLTTLGKAPGWATVFDLGSALDRTIREGEHAARRSAETLPSSPWVQT